MRLYKRAGSPCWQVEFAVGPRGSRRRFRLSTGRTDRQEAGLEAARLRARYARLADQHPRLTLAEALGTWAATLVGRADAVNARLTCDRWLSLLGKDTPIADLADADLSAACARLRAYRGRRGLLTPATVNRHLVHLRAALNHARRTLGADVPTLDWRAHMRREPPGRDRWLTPEELGRLLDASAAHLRPLILMSVWTGLRRAELARLDWRHVDLQAGLARVVQKGGRRRLVYLSSAAVALLASLPGEKREGRVFRRPKPIIRQLQSNYNSWSWETAWRGALRRSGLTDLRWHDLRHTYATWARQSGADLKLLAEAMGVTLSTTARYAHHGQEELRSLAERVAGMTVDERKEKAGGE